MNLCARAPLLLERPLEKYLKKLAGRNDMEDALKRLDKLTSEEVRMAIAQNLRATHSVDDRVRVVADRVLDVDDRVASVDNKVEGVDARVAGVDGEVKKINDKVTVVIDGRQSIFSQFPKQR